MAIESRSPRDVLGRCARFHLRRVMEHSFGIVEVPSRASSRGNRGLGNAVGLAALLGGGFAVGLAGLAMTERRIRSMRPLPPIAGGAGRRYRAEELGRERSGPSAPGRCGPASRSRLRSACTISPRVWRSAFGEHRGDQPGDGADHRLCLPQCDRGVRDRRAPGRRAAILGLARLGRADRRCPDIARVAHLVVHAHRHDLRARRRLQSHTRFDRPADRATWPADRHPRRRLIRQPPTGSFSGTSKMTTSATTPSTSTASEIRPERTFDTNGSTTCPVGSRCAGPAKRHLVDDPVLALSVQHVGLVAVFDEAALALVGRRLARRTASAQRCGPGRGPRPSRSGGDVSDVNVEAPPRWRPRPRR